MKNLIVLALAGAALTCVSQACLAFGEEGHSIVAEIAQRRLTPDAQAEVSRVLGGSMASVASWADGVKQDDQHPETARWHYVDIPRAQDKYDAVRDCQVVQPDRARRIDGGDCVIAELSRLRRQVCAPSDDTRREALRYAIHLVGDIHQPLHTVLELSGGNGLLVEGTIHNDSVCRGAGCVIDARENLHSYWDTGLIRMAYYDWGSYVAFLESDKGPLRDPEVRRLGASSDPIQWAEDTHKLLALAVWPADLKIDDSPTVNKGRAQLDDAYYARGRPLLDKQLALAGLRLAQFLNSSYADPACGAAPPANLGLVKESLKPYYLDPVRDGKTRYELDQAAVVDAATEYLLSRLADQTLKNPAIVLDIDETSLNNLVQLQANDFGFIPNGPCTLAKGYACGNGPDGWDATEKATAIAPTKALFDAAVSRGVKVFFVTGRRQSADEERVTRDNLVLAKYTVTDNLYLRPADDTGTVGAYKAATRARIEQAGYRIIVNLGDQASDLIGGHAEQGFQMPNPFYYIK